MVHISKEDQHSVFAMLAAVLWLGDISFAVIDNENHVEAVTDEGKNFLKVKSKKQFQDGDIFSMWMYCESWFLTRETDWICHHDSSWKARKPRI